MTIELRKQGQIKRIISTVISARSANYKLIHEALQQSMGHFLVFGDSNLPNLLLRSVLDTERRFMLKALETIGDRLFTVQAHRDGKGEECFIEKYKGRNARTDLLGDPVRAMEAVETIPFYVDLMRQDRAEKAEKLKATKAAKAEAVQETKKASSSPIDSGDDVSLVSGLPQIMRKLAERVRNVQGKAELSVTDRNTINVFLSLYKDFESRLSLSGPSSNAKQSDAKPANAEALKQAAQRAASDKMKEAAEIAPTLPTITKVGKGVHAVVL